MSMTHPVQSSSGTILPCEVLMNLGDRFWGQRIAVKPWLRQRLWLDACEVKGLGEKTPLGINSGHRRLPNQITGDQCAIVMTRTAQLQKHPQPFPVSPVNRQLPATTGVEQIPLMHENPVHPETHLVCPPTENKPFKAVFAKLPMLGPGDGLLDS